MNFPVAAFMSLAGELRVMAQALHEKNTEFLEQYSEHPLIKSGLTDEQMMSVARMVFEVSQIIDQQQQPDTLGALSDRVNMKPGEYPLNVVMEGDPDPEKGEYRLSEMAEMGRLAELPILLATQEEKDQFLQHPLVQQGIPSNAFRGIRAESSGIQESFDFQNIVSELIKEDPNRFGGDFPGFEQPNP